QTIGKVRWLHGVARRPLSRAVCHWQHAAVLRGALLDELVKGVTQAVHECGRFSDRLGIEVDSDVEMRPKGYGSRVHGCPEKRPKRVVGGHVCVRPAVVAAGAGKEGRDAVSTACLSADGGKQDGVRQE